MRKKLLHLVFSILLITVITAAPVTKVTTQASAQGTITVDEFPIPTVNSSPWGITAGPDGNVWFTEELAGKIGRITPKGEIIEFRTLATNGGDPQMITTGPDGNLWFTEASANKNGRITPKGDVTEFWTYRRSMDITSGPDDNLWYTTMSYIEHMNTDGSSQELPGNLGQMWVDFEVKDGKSA